MNPSATPWDGDPSRIRVGVEQERFVSIAGNAPTWGETQDFFRYLCGLGYCIGKKSDAGDILAVNKDVPGGYVVIKNDFCTSIIETGLPPVATPEAGAEIFERTWEDIRLGLDTIGASINPGASLSGEPPGLVMVPHDRLKWMQERPVPSPRPPMWHPVFTTMMCATQVHMNIHDDTIYEILPALYAFEYLAPLFFTNSKCFLGQRHYCVRPLAWQQNFVEEYLLYGFPLEIPKTKTDYQVKQKQASRFVRDYSFIVPREYGTVEFRTACAQETSDRAIDLMALRLLGFLTAHSRRNLGHDLTPNREHFFEVCRSGRVDKQLIKLHLACFHKTENLWPLAWRPRISTLCDRMESFCA
jgi:hypothetical protein